MSLADVPKFGEILTTEGIASIEFHQFLEDLARLVNEGEAVSDYALEVARGNVTGVTALNKFGRCTNVDSAVDTDIHDGASVAGGANIIWDAPAAGSIHAIVSDSANDTDGGTGAYSVRVYGLTDWDTPETSEIVTLAGTTPVNTVGSYVIIHRVRCAYGVNSTGGNAGIITATAGAVTTAQILVGEGQTQMAIYGIPSTQTLYINDIYGGVNKATAGSANITLLFNPSPNLSLATFLVKTTFPTNSAGETMSERVFTPPAGYAGPGIIKVQAAGSANNLDVSAGFSGYLVTNAGV